MLSCGAYIHYECSFAVATKGVLQNSGQFRISEGYKRRLRPCEGVNTFSQRGQGVVNGAGLAESITGGSGLFDALAAGQIDEVEIAHAASGLGFIKANL